MILNQDNNHSNELEVDDLALQMGDDSSSISSNQSLDLSLKEARFEFEKEYLISQINRFNGNISKVSDFTSMKEQHFIEKLNRLILK